MKTRVTITLDPAVIRRAKSVARNRHTNLSALIEELLRETSARATVRHMSFTGKWAGRFTVRASTERDDLLDALKRRYHLDES